MGLRCTGCGHDNDPTRVYCHNCGIKLERGGATTAPVTGFTHPTDVGKIKRPRAPLPWGKYFAALVKFFLLVVVVAVLATALIPPRDVPAPLPSDMALAERLSRLASDSSQAGSPRSFAVSAADAGRWFASMVKFAPTENRFQLDPERVYAVQGDGSIRVGLVASFLGVVRVYFVGDYAPVPSAGGYGLRPLRYYIGRLSLPVALGWPVERQMAALGDSLSGPLAPLANASFIGVTPDELTLRWAGASAP